MAKLRKRNKLVEGIGVNDADYCVQPMVGDKQSKCPIYFRWVNVLKRCTPKYQTAHPTYIGCEVCDEWKSFMAFRAWMITQEWEGKDLDKDLLGCGKIYSPENCCFIDGAINKLLTDRVGARGPYLLGVARNSGKGKPYRAQLSKYGYRYGLGYFDTQEEAHLAYCKAKLDHARDVVKDEEPRVREAVIARLTEQLKAAESAVTKEKIDATS